MPTIPRDRMDLAGRPRSCRRPTARYGASLGNYRIGGSIFGDRGPTQRTCPMDGYSWIFNICVLDTAIFGYLFVFIRCPIYILCEIVANELRNVEIILFVVFFFWRRNEKQILYNNMRQTTFITRTLDA